MLLNDPLSPQLPVSRNYKGKFTLVDNEEIYSDNLKKFGNNWRYATKEIYYDFNSLGYRTKDIDYFKDKDFVLILGGSHAQGAGLAEDEIWHVQIQKEFGYEILNAGATGTGPDIQMLNSYLFLKNFTTKPKAVVIQWPNVHRFTFKGDNETNHLFPSMNLKGNIIKSLFKTDDIEKFYQNWIYDNNSLNHSQFFIEVTKLLWELSNVPCYGFHMDNEGLFENLDIENLNHLIVENDLARDQMHYGHLSHQAIGKEICNKLRKIVS